MIDTLWSEHWFRWAIGLAVAFPLVAILLGEVAVALQRVRHPLGKPILLIRNVVLPVMVLWLFVTQIAYDHVAPTSILAKGIATTFYLLSLLGLLGLLNVLVFRTAEAESWQAKVPDLFLDLSRFIMVLIGTAIVLSTVWGADLGGLLAALGVGSIVVGLALQETLGNVFSGIAILFEQPYKEGDWVRVDDWFGKVETINWRTTRLTTYSRDTVVIPNGKMASSVLMNESGNGADGFEKIEIGFSYDNPPNFVKQVLLDTVSTTELVRTEPPPQVFTKEYGDSAIVYEIRFAVKDMQTLPAVKDAVSTRLWYAAKRNGLNIPFPIRTVFNYDGKDADEQSDAEVHEAGSATVSSVLPIDSVESFSEGVTIKRFGQGETIIHVGNSVRVLYLIVSGTVSQTVRFAGRRHEVRELGAGELFGAAEVLRSMDSKTQTVAARDVVVVLIARDVAMKLVSTKPGFARQLEETIEAQLVAEARARIEGQPV